ncbi:hypothetical protein AAULR_10975, partial [Lacticaseibacillus rhamnosus MTCC 5462]
MRFICWQQPVATDKNSSGSNITPPVTLTGDDEMIDNLFPKLAAMMSVEFVRSGQYTVVPYPVKYLREFWLS